MNLKSKAKRLLVVTDLLKELEAEANALKAIFKEEIGNGALEVGGVLVTVDEAERASIDKEELQKHLSKSKIDLCTKITEYKIVRVRKVS